MIRRKPTTIELSQEDIEELEGIVAERGSHAEAEEGSGEGSGGEESSSRAAQQERVLARERRLGLK